MVVAGVLGLDGGAERFMPWGNFYAYAVGGYEYYDYGPCALRSRRSCDRNLLITRPTRSSTSW